MKKIYFLSFTILFFSKVVFAQYSESTGCGPNWKYCVQTINYGENSFYAGHFIENDGPKWYWLMRNINEQPPLFIDTQGRLMLFQNSVTDPLPVAALQEERLGSSREERYWRADLLPGISIKSSYKKEYSEKLCTPQYYFEYRQWFLTTFTFYKDSVAMGTLSSSTFKRKSTSVWCNYHGGHRP